RVLPEEEPIVRRMRPRTPVPYLQHCLGLHRAPICDGSRLPGQPSRPAPGRRLAFNQERPLRRDCHNLPRLERRRRRHNPARSIQVALLTIAHLLITSVRRRRDFAILRALGFTSWQVRGTLCWQAVTLAGMALVTGVPAGIACG